MSIFGFNRRNERIQENEEYEFYEDTHDENGEYTATNKQYSASKSNDAFNSYRNIMVYEPKTTDDIQDIIDFLKTRESAIIKLDETEEVASQRFLDFVSGAVYALNGNIYNISGNIYLLSPEGAKVTNSPVTEKK